LCPVQHVTQFRFENLSHHRPLVVHIVHCIEGNDSLILLVGNNLFERHKKLQS
jgi:hypothetical protein